MQALPPTPSGTSSSHTIKRTSCWQRAHHRMVACAEVCEHPPRLEVELDVATALANSWLVDTPPCGIGSVRSLIEPGPGAIDAAHTHAVDQANPVGLCAG